MITQKRTFKSEGTNDNGLEFFTCIETGETYANVDGELNSITEEGEPICSIGVKAADFADSSPAPWIVIGSYVCTGGTLTFTRNVCEMLRPYESESRANAQLIAAAPELLAICKLVVQRGMEQPSNAGARLTQEDWLLARSVVAKAEGRKL